MAASYPKFGDHKLGDGKFRHPGPAPQLKLSACAWLLVLCFLAASGLACRRAPVLGKVHGQVSFQRQPLAAGILGFSNRQTGVHMTANLDADGRYQVSMAKGFGLPPGKYEVAVYPFIADLPIGSTERPVHHEFPNIPERYRKPETSGLSIDVHEGDNPYDVDMEP